MPETRTKKPATDSSEAVRARIEKNPMAGPMVLAFHRKWQLWRLCDKKACQRARACRGDELACGARRWKVTQSILAKLKARGVDGLAAERLVWRSRALWSEVNGVLCEHKELLFLGMPKGPFLHVVRENPDGTKTVLSHQDLTEEQARKLAQKCEN
jgi:hypothetical protein